MAFPIAQGVACTLNGNSVANVTQVTINESAPTIETSDMSLAENSYRTFIPGLKDAADITLNHIGGAIALGNNPQGFACGDISFDGATVMSSEVSYRVGEIVGYTTTIRAAND